MKALKLILAIILGIAAMANLSSCHHDDPVVDVPFTLAVTPTSQNGVMNVASNFNATIDIPASWTQSTDNVKFKVTGQVLDGAFGDMAINGQSVDATNPIEVAKGDFTFTYTNSAVGTYNVVLTATNDAKKSVRDTIQITVKQFPTVNFSVSATPNDWTSVNSNPGTKQDFELKITSSAAASWKYKLFYDNITSNGKGEVYISSALYGQGGELPSRDLTLQLNIPATHPNGTFQLKLRIQDANLDEHDVILTYFVTN